MGNFCSRIENEIYAEEGSRLPPVHEKGISDDYELIAREYYLPGKQGEGARAQSEGGDKNWAQKGKRNHYEDNNIQKSVGITKV